MRIVHQNGRFGLPIVTRISWLSVAGTYTPWSVPT